jgi:hypothetical protein
MTTILVMTTGQTDVQIVDQQKKWEIDKDYVGALHDQLRDHPDWVLVDAPAERGRPPRQTFPQQLPWEICTPKFDAVLTYFGDTLPDRVILLGTERQTRGDPRFAGKVLEKRARARAIKDIRHCAYLGLTDRDLEDPECPLDAIIRRDVVRRIEDAIRDGVGDATRIVVATVGGMPEVKSLVKELVRLHAPHMVEPDEIEVDDGARTGGGQPDKAISRRRIDPVEPVRLRKQALSLIEKGNLLGALGAVAHLDKQTHPWTQTVHWLAQFASSLPFDPPLPAGSRLEVLGHSRMAVRAALRVELALRAGDIPRAVHGTVAFFEAALWDHLGEKTLRHPSKRQFKFRVAPAEDLVRERDAAKLAALSKIKQREDRDRPFIFKETADGSDWYWIDDNEICAVQIAKHYLKLENLTKLGQALAGDIRELRNDVAHNEPTPELMNDARSRMQQAELWSNTTPAAFLSQPLVQAVLKDLGETNPENVLANLLVSCNRGS